MKSKSLFLASLLAFSSSVFADETPSWLDKEALEAFDEEYINLGGIFSTTLEQYPNCLAYAIVGVSLYCEPTYYGCDYYVTLRVAHNNPDMMTLANRQLDETPWKEWNKVFGKGYASTTESIFKSIMPDELQSIPVYDGNMLKDNYGKHQAVGMREAEVLGHPASIISRMFDQGGLQNEKPNPNYTGGGDNSGGGDEPATIECEVAGCLEESGGDLGESIGNQQECEEKEKNGQQQCDNETALEEDGREYIESWPDTTALPGSIASFFDIAGFAETIAGNSELVEFLEGVGEQVSNVASQQGAKGNRLLCSSTITPVVPYYLSGVDSIQWRSGYPVTDPHQSATILNPLSVDTIGPTGQIWGYMHPREGTVNNAEDGNASAVIQVRSMNIANDEQNFGLRIRVEPPESTVSGGGGWSVNFPTATANKSCRANIANLKHYNNIKWNHMSTNWRRYKCDLQSSGIYLGTAPIGPIYITPKIPE